MIHTEPMHLKPKRYQGLCRSQASEGGNPHSGSHWVHFLQTPDWSTQAIADCRTNKGRSHVGELSHSP